MAGILTSGFYSLFANYNKARGKGADGEKQEGLIESLGELTLDKDDKELNDLEKSWALLFKDSTTYKKIHTEGDINQRYWIGKQFPDSEYENGKRPLTDNIIFEAVETMIPQATQQNPEPIVGCDNTVEMKIVADKLHMALEYLAQYNHLKTKLKKGVRHWTMRFLGCWQIGYNGEEQEIVIKVINPKDLELDPNGYIDDGEYVGEFLNLKLYDNARNLITRFPEHEDKITKIAEGKLGSLLGYKQCWTDEFVFYKLKDIILHKSKNPNFNYPTQSMTVGPNGEQIPQTIPGHNHFSRPKIPFVFLTCFDLGDMPCDSSGLVQQGLVTQDNINKGLKQYDRNVDNINGGVVVNGLMFNKEQAAQVAEARRQGRTIVTPGEPEKALMFPENHDIPEVVYERIQDDRTRFMSRFGIAGSTPDQSSQEETVRGKIIVGQQDTSRTGGGVTEFLELAASRIFNHFLQMIYVYWDTPHTISVIGPENTQTMQTLQSQEIPQGRKFTVTVQNGSMVPQDELSIYNEAMGEYEAGVLDPLSYFEKTKDPNPVERATKLMIYKTNPALYMQQFLQIAPPPAVAPAPNAPVSTSGAPPSSVPPEKKAPTAEQAQSSSLIKSQPLPKT
jgi:hypothetical protein